MNGQQMLDSGTHKVCQCQRALIPTEADRCRACAEQAGRAQRHQPPTVPAPVRQSRPRRPSYGRALRIGDAVIPDERAGGLARLPGRTAMFGAAGVPVPQGSMAAVAPGVVKRSNASELLAWRKAIYQSLTAFVGQPGWENPDCPIRFHVALTMPKPDRWGIVADHTIAAVPGQEHAPRVAPSTRPDLDKLLRAAGDALAPKNKPGAYTDDGRIVDFRVAQSYPYPEHVHAWALGTAGVVIRVCPADVDVAFPELTLRDPGPRPAELSAAVDAELLAPRVPLPTRKAG